MKKALVVGAARSGKYISLLLNDNDYAVTLTDINTVDYKDELVNKGIKVYDNGHPDYLLNEKYDLVIKNPGIKYTADFIVKLLELDYKIYNEIEIALRYVYNTKIFAISGTNGKTTTVSMLYEILKASDDNTYLGGNIGVPISEIIYKHKNINNLVIELSSFQLDGMYDFKADFCAITNLNADHLDYYKNEDEYYKSKQKIYKKQNENDYLIINNDDKVAKYLDNPKSKVINVDKVLSTVDSKVYYEDDLLFDTNKLLVVGKHNIDNAKIASTMAYLAGIDSRIIFNALSNFKAIEHRIEYVNTINGVKFYNDSKATNVDSLIVALESFDQKIILLAGGFDKHISFELLRNYNDKIKKAILFGQTK